VEETNGSAAVTGLNTLQWGHGDEAVEEAAGRIGDGVMCFGLQWGHGDEAVEEARPALT